MDIVVYQTASLHNVLTRMGVSLAKALKAIGANAAFYSATAGEVEADVISDLQAGGVRAVIAFGSGGAEWCYQDGTSVYDRLGCAFIGWDVDHPSYNRSRFILPMARRGQICASASHVAFARAMGCHAIARLMLPGVDEVAENPLPIAERPIHGLVAMSWIGEPEVWWADAKGTPVYALVEGIVGRVLADPGADLFAALQATCNDLSLQVSLDGAMCELIGKISLFVRRYDRLRLAHALAAADVPCAICGDGWRERLGAPKHLLHASNLDVEGLAQLYGHARVIFNVNGANGASERAIQAMAAGAAVVSDYSPVLESSFISKGAIGLYDRRDMAGVQEMLSLPSDAQQMIADYGRQLVAKAHLWSHKAAELIEMLRETPFGIDITLQVDAASQ